MWIPEHFDPSANARSQPPGSTVVLPDGKVDAFAELREWSSIIGIVTAIVGNILISFALNIQRYAHIRIDREHNESNVSLSKGGGRTPNGRRAYGATTQEQIAEERAQLNANAPGPGNRNSDSKIDTDDRDGTAERNVHERAPLLKTYDSGSTLTSLEKGSEKGGERKSYLRSPYWWAGIFLMTVGEAGNFLAYGFAPASIVSPLGVVALVSNCIIAPFMLKERFRMRDGWGVLVAIAGAVTVVLSAKNSETKLGQDELWDAISRWEFLTYVGITAGVIVALMFASPKYGDRTILIDLGLVGLFGGYTALSTKGVASLLSDTLWRALTFPITYLLVAILILSALMQIHYVNRALQRFDSTQVIPIQFVTFTISVIIGSAVLYRDFESTTAERAAKFIGGCLLTFFGVYLITSGRPQENDEEEGDSIDEEEGIHMVDDEADYQDPALSKQHTRDSNISSRRGAAPPRTPDRKSSDATTSSLPQTPCTTHSQPLEISDEQQTPWSTSSSSSSSSTTTPPSNLVQTPISPSQPSPFTRAQSGPPESPTFTRLRPTQSHQQPFPSTPDTASPTPKQTPHLYLRSPSTPTTTRPGAESALRAHLSPTADPGPHPHPPLNRTARGSFGRLLPGPLLSPLSSGLSAVVAESLRRGEAKGFGGGGSGRGAGKQRGRGEGAVKKRGKRGSVAEGARGDPDADGDGGGAALRADAGNEIRDLTDGKASVEAKKAKLLAISDSLGDLVARRRRDGHQEGGSEGSASVSASASGSPDPSSRTPG